MNFKIETIYTNCAGGLSGICILISHFIFQFSTPSKSNIFQFFQILNTLPSLYLYLADFLKTNLTKFAVISVKKPQKARFSSPTSPKIMATIQGKEKEKKKERGEGKEEKKKKQWLHS